MSEMKNEVKKSDQYISGDDAGGDGVLGRLREVCEEKNIDVVCDKSLVNGEVFYNPVEKILIYGINVKEEIYIEAISRII